MLDENFRDGLHAQRNSTRAVPDVLRSYGCQLAEYFVLTGSLENAHGLVVVDQTGWEMV